MFHPAWLLAVDEERERGEVFPLRWVALLFICLALLIGQVDVTIITVALPSIGTDLDATTSELQWVMDAYSITLAGFVLLGGGLADRYGRKGVFIIGCCLFAVASLSGVFATEPWHLIGSRALMGLGAALFFPPALSLLAVMFAPEERPKAVAIWAAAGGLGTVLGPVIGGILLDSFWWGSVLLVNVPVTLVAVVGTALVVPTSRRPGAPGLDRVGGVLSVIGLAALIFGIIEGPGRGWTSPLIVAAIVFGLTAVVAFVRWELRVDAPMVDVRVFQNRGVAGGGLSLTVNLLAMTGALFALPLYLQSVEARSPMAVGLMLVPFGVTFAALAFTAGPAARRFGVRPVLTGGLVVMAAGLVLLSFAADVQGVGIVLIGTAVFGAGAAYVAPPGTAAVINALPTAKAGDASAVNQITRQVGAALGTAVVGTVLASIYTRELASAITGLTPGDQTTAEASITGAESVASSLSTGGASLLEAANSAFTTGYRIAMLVPAALSLVAAVVVFLTLRERERTTS